MRKADLVTDLAKFNRSMAFGAFLPQATVSYQSLAYQKDPVMSPKEFSTTAAQIAMPVVAPSAWFLFGAAQGGYASAKMAADYTRQNTALQAAIGFYTALVQEDVVSALEAQCEAVREQCLRVEGLGKEGVAVSWEVGQARWLLQAREAQLNQARRRLAVARGELLRDMGFSPTAPITLSRELPPLAFPEGDVTERVLVALSQHPELALADREVVVRENMVRAAIAQFVPVVSVAAQYSRHDKPMMEGMGLPLANWNLSFNAVWNVFTGFYNLANYRAAKAERERSKLEREKTFLSIIVRVVAADATLADATERMAVAELAYESAKGKFEDYDARAREGLLPTSDALDARSAMDAAQIEVVQSRYLERIAAESLRLSMGIQ
ncbi:MAG: TolC family protein [Kiritimatiellaeota bacterium]|nr:TolC family protein [Kiritimatiellota bacterium]